jgi:very-short-patch-repair endonuclease
VHPVPLAALSDWVVAKERIDAEIALRVTARGLITSEALRRLGLSQRAITDRCAAGRLIRVHHGVYFVGHAERTPLALAEAAVLACGPRAALSHDSAAALYGLRRWPPVPEVSSALQRRRPRIRAHRATTLTRAEVAVREGIAVTTPARTLADIAPRLTDRQLTRAIHEARRNGDLPDPALGTLLGALTRAALLVDSGAPPSESALEDAFRAFLADNHLPFPEFQIVWHGFRVDALYREQRLIVELDGRRDHGVPDRFEDDRARDALALELGVATLRVTWRRLHREPERLAHQLRSILADRERRGGPPRDTV